MSRFEFNKLNPYSCPRCGCDSAAYTEEEWDTDTNTETLRMECFKCKCEYTVVTKYEAVDIVKKEGWIRRNTNG